MRLGTDCDRSIAVDWLSETSNKDASGVLHYFCDFTARRQQTELGILQSILRKTMDQRCEEIVPIFSKYLRDASSAPKVDDLFGAVKEVSSQLKFYLVIDALDELDSPQSIFSLVHDLVQAGCSVLVTSGDHPDIRKVLSTGRQLGVYSHIEDMALYIQHRFKESDFRDIVMKGHTLVDTVS